MIDVEALAWELMVAAHGDAVHEIDGLAEALLPRYRERVAQEAKQYRKAPVQSPGPSSFEDSYRSQTS